MLGQEATSHSDDPNVPEPIEKGTVWTEIFDLEGGTCPKCFAPIEPERLPAAELCLDCNVER